MNCDCNCQLGRLRSTGKTLLSVVVGIVFLGSPLPAQAQAQLDGRIVGPGGAGVAAVTVSLTLAAAQTPVASVRTDASGEFIFENLAAGNYVLRVSAQGFRPTERRVTLNATDAVRVELPLALALEEAVTVVGVSEPQALDTPSDTGSRLGLTSRELPASLDIMPQRLMRARGQRTAGEAIESAVGVIFGNSPGNPGSFSTRGFTNNRVSVVYDGLRLGPPGMVSRQLDVWNLERIEVLKGPASAMFGEGAVGGAVNYVVKRPDRGPQRSEGLFEYGSFNTRRLGLGAGGPVGDNGLHYRVDYSLNESDGFINNTPSTLQSLTSALAWDSSSTMRTQVSFDVLDDDITSYWGTPLVPESFASEPLAGVVRTDANETIDRRMSRVNYNVGDDVMQSTAFLTRVKNEWRATPGVLLRNEFYHLSAEREWKNAETYGFNAETNLIDRDRFFVAHDQSFVGYRVDVEVDQPVGGYANRFVAGLDINSVDFVRPSFFTRADSVDPFNPVAGAFGPLTPAEQIADIATVAFYAEDYFPIRSNLKIGGSIRAERIDLDRQLFDREGNLDPGPSFARVFTPFTWKTGLIYDVRPNASIYGHFGTAADPVGTDLFLVDSSENFDLATGRQFEIGTKQTLPRGLGEWTAAYYWVERKDFLVQTSLIAAEPVGQQSSRGVELSASLEPVSRWQLHANLAFVDAQFDEFNQVVGDDLVSREGNRPFNVPRVVVGLWSSYRFGDRQPVVVGGSYRHVSDRFSTVDNSIRLLSYDVADLFATWLVGQHSVTVRVRNLFDEDYAIWGDNFYPTQVLLGQPRSAEVNVGFSF